MWDDQNTWKYESSQFLIGKNLFTRLTLSWCHFSFEPWEDEKIKFHSVYIFRLWSDNPLDQYAFRNKILHSKKANNITIKYCTWPNKLISEVGHEISHKHVLLWDNIILHSEHKILCMCGKHLSLLLWEHIILHSES